jgi:lysozyme
MRPVPKRAIKLLQEFEGLHDGDKKTPNILEPQADPIGIYTTGWGYALFENGKPVKDYAQAMRIFKERWPNGFGRLEADNLLEEVAQQVCNRVCELVTVAINDNELSALISLAYNIGTGEEGGAPDFADSTVRKRLLKGDRVGAAEAFQMWRFAGGKELPGLVRRRKAEADTFSEPVTESKPETGADDLTIPPVPAAPPPPLSVSTPETVPAHKSTVIWGAQICAVLVPLVIAVAPSIFMHFGYDAEHAQQAANALATLLAVAGGSTATIGRADANIRPLGRISK